MVLIFVVMIGCALLFAWHPALGIGGTVLLFIGLFTLPERVANRFTQESAVIVLDDVGLTVRSRVVNGEYRVNFANLASYSISGGSQITLRPRTGRPLRLHLNYKLQPQGIGAMCELQHHFERAVVEFQRQHPERPPIRNLSFLDQRRAAILLVFLAALLLWRGWWLMVQPIISEGQLGGLIVGGLLFTLYALVWWHHRRPLQQL